MHRTGVPLFPRALVVPAFVLTLLGLAAGGEAQTTCTDPDPSPLVVIDGCDTGVPNLLLEDGCSINDRIALCVQAAANHGEFVSCVSALASDLRNQGRIQGAQRGTIVSCAARADLPPGVETVVTITSPANGSTVPDRQVEVAGTVQPAPAAGTVDLLGFTAPVTSAGDFVITGFPLRDGENLLQVEALDGGTTIGWAEVTVFHFFPSEASVSVTPEQGGSATVTDPASPIFGAGIDIPDGAATRSFRALVVSDPEHVPNLPFGELPVGPPVAFGPEAEELAAPVTLTLPFDPGALPAGTAAGDVRIRALGDGGWEELPASSIAVDRVTVSLDRLIYSPLIVVVDAPLAPGQLLVTTDPANATLYLDRVDTGARTPAILDGVPAGSHELKAYLPGFNEVFHTVSVPSSGARVALELGVPVEPIPVVTLDPALQDGMEVSASFIDVVADVSYTGAPLTSGLAVLSVNGEDGFEPIDPDGRVRGAVALFPGDNLLEVRVTGPNGSTGRSETINIIRSSTVSAVQAPATAAQDITVRLAWNTDTTDLDLHVFDPSGNHAWFGNLGGIPGGRLDRDDVDGFGPEVFTLPSPPAGTYRVAVDSFRIDGIPTVATLTIRVGDRDELGETYLFTASDFNVTNGNPAGANPAAFWDAHTFEVGELRIVSIETHQDSPQDEAIFTTAMGERQITVTAEAPESIDDADIRYEVEETEESFEIDTSMLSGRTVMFDAAHEPLQGLTDPRLSHRLTYRILAFSLDENGERDLESEPETLTQEVRSQIRQEYVDKRAFTAEFVRATPDRDSIIDAGGFTRQPDEFFDFEEFSGYSDFGPALAVIDASRDIANTLRRAWGQPLRTTSGWRNPRRNDSLRNSVVNSFHQTGDAIDLNPSRNPMNWPQTVPNCLGGQQITTYDQAQQALTCLANRTFGADYDIRFHANHLHIELDP